jgi:hypothetical protein
MKAPHFGGEDVPLHDSEPGHLAEQNAGLQYLDGGRND